MKKTKRYKIFGWLAAILVLLLLIVLGGSVYMLSFALTPGANDGRVYAREYRVLFEHYPETRPWVDSLRKAHALRDTFVVAADGDRHHALLVDAPRPMGKTAVLVHGYCDCAVTMLSLGYVYHRVLGYNLVVPDLHASGKSEGKAIQMGWKDRIDVLQWIAMADSLYRAPGRQAAIVVHGISMGAATTMCVAGEQTPASVRGFVEDCGYTSAWDEFAQQLNDQFGLPEFPLLYTTSALCKLRYGWSFGEASPLEQVRKCRKPMLFVHGTRDTYVPYRMLQVLYDAKPGTNKSIEAFPGAVHAESYYSDKRAYTEMLRRWLGTVMGE